ncbi:MAG: SGNH/GDSL hydrolase family protein [Pseudomonadota bacterium]
MRRLLSVSGDVMLLPVLGAQALWVVSRAMRLPEAAGARSGAVGQGKPLRLLIVGDSSAAGVGVPDQQMALAGRLSSRLAKTRRVEWQVLAASGGTAASTLRLMREAPGMQADVAVVALGVNDTKNGVPIARWRARYAGLMDLLQDRFGVEQIIASGLPPLGRFPLLPQPLRGVLGRRAVRFDQVLEQLCEQTAAATFVPLDLEMNTDQMAPDGFHPGPDIYDAWAGLIAARLQRTCT